VRQVIMWLAPGLSLRSARISDAGNPISTTCGQV
jgi:hypothetical protein